MSVLFPEPAFRHIVGQQANSDRPNDPAMNDPDSIAADLKAALAKETDGPVEVTDLRRLTAGATKATWAFTATIAGQTQPLILQVSRPRLGDRARTDPQAALPLLSGSEDAAIQRAAAAAGIAVPHVRFIVSLDGGESLGAAMPTIRNGSSSSHTTG